MRYGISAAALVINDDSVLMVHHREPGYDFWVPPGGKLEGEESIFECAARETFEETGLAVELDKIAYIREFVEPGYHFCKFFITCARWSGEVTLDNKPADEDHLVDARFISRDKLAGMTVYPEIMKDRFWSDSRTGFPVTRYLGLGRPT